MRRPVLALVVALALCGGPALAQQAGPPVVSLAPAGPPDTPQIARIRAALKGYLRNEKTARIRIVRDVGHASVSAYGKTQTGQILCTQVNATDAKGVYAGYRPFMFVLQANGQVGVWQHGVLRGSDRIMETICGWKRD